MSRCTRRVIGCCIAMALVLWVQRPADAQRSTASKPDVLLLCIDDLNDWVGCLGGHPQAKTPNIDRLAKRGVLFSNAHCQSPVCLSSRASFMTGTRPSSNGIYLLGPKLRASPRLEHAKTLPEHFADHGYQTLGAGKVYHASGNTETFQTYGPRGNFGPLPPEAERIHYTMDTRLWDWGAYPDTDDKMPDVKIAQWAVDQLKEPGDQPRFLAVGFLRPHVPLYAPQPWFDLQPALDDITLPTTPAHDRDDLSDYAKRLTHGAPAPRHSWMLEHDQWKTTVRAYLATIRFVDAQVGKVLDALDESGRRDQTLVILLSDHGFHLGEKERWAKRSLWERATRVPLIIAGPGIEPGRECKEPAGLIDLYPTLVDLCELGDPGGLEGDSLAPQLTDVGTPRGPAITTWWVGNHAVRSARYRFIHYADGSEEFYDHQTDPHEWTNLVDDARYSDLITEHRTHLPTNNAPSLPSNVALGVAPEDREFFAVPR